MTSIGAQILSPQARNLPNALTGLRVLLAPVLALVLVVDGGSVRGRVLALLVFVVAGLTDVVDGRLARSRGLCTDLGAFLDPIADKLILATALVGLSALAVVPWWITAVVLGREVVVTAVRTAVLRYGVIAANRGGKIKAVSQSVAIILCLAPLPGGLAWGRTTARLVTTVLTVVTGAVYVVEAGRLHASGTGPGAPTEPVGTAG